MLPFLMYRSILNILIILLVLAITLIYATYQKRKIHQLTTASNDTLMVEALPSFELESFPDRDKITADLLHREGAKLLVVHFWGTWCAPCLPEFPQILEFARQFTGDSRVQFLLVAVRDKRSYVAKFIDKMGAIPDNVLLGLDPKGNAMSSFGTVKVPETYYYFKRRSAKRFIGPQEWKNDYFTHELKKLL